MDNISNSGLLAMQLLEHYGILGASVDKKGFQCQRIPMMAPGFRHINVLEVFGEVPTSLVAGTAHESHMEKVQNIFRTFHQ